MVNGALCVQTGEWWWMNAINLTDEDGGDYAMLENSDDEDAVGRMCVAVGVQTKVIIFDGGTDDA